jgi:16S rRNA (adenine1518-N6/adenine1519-N6)-dimethyltransferase
MTAPRCSCAVDVPLHARKSLGQNFLVDVNYQRRIIEALAPASGDTVVEIGPGPGALTQHLVGRVQSLTVIELDDRFAAALAEAYGGRADVRVLHQDALTVEFSALGVSPADLKVVGNIPYNITTPLIFHLLRSDQRAGCIVLMVQREVADRILASPGGREYGALSVGVRAVAAVERLFNVPRGAFRPAPNVDSTVLRLRPFFPPPLSTEAENDLRTLTRTAFGWRRKQLRRILRDAPVYQLDEQGVESLAQAGFDPAARPETLAPERFVELAALLRAGGLPLERVAEAERR